MDISLLHAGLAAGAALAALPVILHLFMKQTPKRVVFPALQLIRERQKRSQKKLKVKNWLLLLARMALVALMALALARPRLSTEASQGDEEVPTAMALVFDTSLSMGYRDQPDKTLLDLAKERAQEILKKTPDTSQVFVVDSSVPGAVQPMSPAAARKQIEGLALRAANRPLNAALGQAYAAVVPSELPRHEVYVLTDLASTSWNPSGPVEGLELLKKVKSGVVTYVLQLSPGEVKDVAVVAAKPSSSVATQGESVEIQATLRSYGPATKRIAELVLDGIKKDQKTVEIPAASPDKTDEVEVKFTTPKLDPAVPMHQGLVRLSGAPDPLRVDDERFFTFKVQPARKVVIVSDLAIDAEFIRDALDPTALPPGMPRQFHVTQLPAKDFAAKPAEPLKDATCVFVNNVAELSPEAWGKLGGFVRDGGGLVLGMGNHCLPENYGGAVAAQLLPATLGPQSKAVQTTFGRFGDATHPLFRRFPKQLEEALAQVPVSRYWPATPREGARTLLSYADNAPALLELAIRGPKSGHVLLWTTPLSRRVDRESEGAWNEFPVVGWGFYFLMNQMVPYLAGTSEEKLTYEAGEDVVLPIDPTRRFKNYMVQGPAQTGEPHTPPPTSDALVIVAPQAIGQWSVAATAEDGAKASMGFSVNPPAAESNFHTLKKPELDALFGKAKYHLAGDTKSLEHERSIVLIGHEAFPWLMALILLLVTAENFLANRFYREKPAKVSV